MSEVNRIAISPQEMAMGMSFENQINAGLARLEAAQTAQQMFVSHLRSMHNAPPEQYQLRDWAIGFERVEKNEDKESHNHG